MPMKTVIKLSGRIIPLIQMGANPTRVYNEVLQVIAEAPTVDAVEVVRCRDCKSYNGHRYCNYLAEAVLDGDFCSYGERR